MRPSKEDLLDDIFGDDDPDGLLNVKPAAARTNDEDRLLAQFADINAFVGTHGHAPTLAGKTMSEKLLATRLKALRAEEQFHPTLAPHDIHGILRPRPEEAPPETLEDIFADDGFDLLGGEDDLPDLYTFKHTPREQKSADYVASRKKCKDFDRFEHLFQACHAELRAGKRQLTSFKNTQDLAAGQFHVLKGVLLYIAEIGERHIRGKSGDYDARTRTIYENGTESDILMRSLASALYADGKRVTYHEDRVLDGMLGVTADDEASGYIYVLRSQSTHPEIAGREDLYKIGFSSGPIEDRIRNAANEPTYLMAPVEIVDGWRCYNMNPRKLESLLHTFFGSSCLDLQVAGPDGRYHTPREWFIAPLPIIVRAVELIISGEVVKYRYEPTLGGITER